MAELKTKATSNKVEDFVNQIAQEWKKEDSQKLIQLFKRITHAEPVMWGDSIIGFGNYKFVYKSGRELDWFLGGFSPRKTALTIYLMYITEEIEQMLPDLGKYKKGKGCLYIKKLADVDVNQLESIIKKSIELVLKRYKEYN